MSRHHKILYNPRVTAKVIALGALSTLLASCTVHPLTPTPAATATLPGAAASVVTFTPTATWPPTRTLSPTETALPGVEPSQTSVPLAAQPALMISTVASVTEAPLAPAPPSNDVAAAEQYTIDLINAQRAAVGVAPLFRDETLMGVARARVQDMIARGYTGHTDPATGEALARKMIRAAGYTSSYLGENWYGTIQPPPAIVEVAMGWFMTDPPHAQNILNVNYVAVGVGIGYNGRQWLLIQNFVGANP
jgi:uncharacterized protein YkwD